MTDPCPRFKFSDERVQSWIIKAHLEYWMGMLADTDGYYVNLIVVPVAGWTPDDTPLFMGEDNHVQFTPGKCDDWIFEGFLKWDGCSDFSFNNGHFCSPEQAADLGTLMTCAYHQAYELMSQHARMLNFKQPHLTVVMLPFDNTTNKLVPSPVKASTEDKSKDTGQ